MEGAEVNVLVKQLAAGFETLQEEYQKLFGQYQGLERKLATAREQYNELAKLCDSGSVATPPLSLTSSPKTRHADLAARLTASNILEQRPDIASKSAAQSVSLATKAADHLRTEISKVDTAGTGVRIWSGPSADRPERNMMPSISESPLEQDFTVEGKPSKLGCPFASMAGKKLSSHAASVLSRYNPSGSGAASPAREQSNMSVRSSVSRVNGKESFARRAASDRRASFADPIKAEICGLDSHDTGQAQEEDKESPMSERAATQSRVAQQQEAGVCPIRFLDQHSPEEVATYFERHKHELPRSHEICVKRYQSNEKQIRELDEKYGNLVSMIQGLGEKHQNYLPKDPDPEEGDENDDVVEDDGKRDEKIQKWASSVSAQAGEGDAEKAHDEGRKPHFERPLRDIRVGESPSRPWGISVPAKYVEEAVVRSEASTSPAKVRPTGMNMKTNPEAPKEGAKCPFGFDKAENHAVNDDVAVQAAEAEGRPVFVNYQEQKQEVQDPSMSDNIGKMVFTGPVFIGYSVDDAAKILRDSGHGKST